MNEFKQKIINFANRIHFIPSQEKTLKIIFSGLDAAGKTSIRYALDSKESQLNLNNPTIGIERNTRQIGNFINVIEWDCGGQEKYRAQFLRRAENYLDETDGLFYVIDVKKPESYKESVEYLKKNIEFLRQINRYIPIAILLHKFDPNLEMSEEMIRGIVKIKEEIAEIEPEFHVMVFETSIFNPKTLWNAYSMLFSHISPNRDILKEQIKRFCNENNMVGMVVIHEDRIIISRYITDRYETMFSDEFIYSYVSLFKTLNEYDYAQYQKYGVEFENFVIKYFSIEGSEKNYSILLILDNAVKSINDFNADQIRFDIKNKIDGLIQAYH
jgi:GTPase SAR1 family protein